MTTDKLTRFYFSPHTDFNTNGSIHATRYGTYEECEQAALASKFSPNGTPSLMLVKETHEVVARVVVKATYAVVPLEVPQ